MARSDDLKSVLGDGFCDGRRQGHRALFVLSEALREHDDTERLTGERVDELTLELLDARSFRGDTEPEEVDVFLGGCRALLLDHAEELLGDSLSADRAQALACRTG